MHYRDYANHLQGKNADLEKIYTALPLSLSQL
jgi:hypothetical protein